MTAIPYGGNGYLLGLRLDDPDHDLPGDLCLPLPVWSSRWQRGCPLTDLPAAAPWRPATDVTGPAATRPAGPGATNPTGDTR